MEMESAISRADVPARPVIGDLNSLLEDIHLRHIALKREDCQRHYRVFREVFHQLNANMRAADAYYRRYCNNIQFAGSHYERLRIKKPDVFYMEILIDVPVNMKMDPVNPVGSNITIEYSCPGIVRLRAGTQYQKFLIREGQDCQTNRPVHEWLNSDGLILRSKFINWFRSVVCRGLNLFETLNDRPVHYMDGVAYTIDTVTREPAWTIIIVARGGFRLCVDLVPALKFPDYKWLGGNYLPIPPECHRDYWMVVPKLNRGWSTQYYLDYSWRVALQDQEQQLLKNTYHLRQIMRLLKKLRDSQEMHRIANYDLKTLFLWEVDEKKNTDPTFWQRNDVATLFKHMLKKFCEALEKRSVPYFWNKSYNMIEILARETSNEYKGKVDSLLSVLEDPSDYSSVARYMLTSEEYQAPSVRVYASRYAPSPSAQEDRREQRDFLVSLSDSLQAIVDNSSRDNMEMESAISRADVPARPVIGDLNSLLEDIHVRHIALKREDFERHYRVFHEVFRQLNANMRAADAYYRRYCSNIQFAGSHYDRLRINKPGEFYMDIVIDVPVNMHIDPLKPDESDIYIEDSCPGIVRLRAGTQYQKFLIREGQDYQTNRAVHKWLRSDGYILRSKFTDWFRSVVSRGLNLFETLNDRPVHYVDGVAYTIHRITREPAWTIIIAASGFRLDVDLVPALKFPEHMWLGWKCLPIPRECHRGYWMVVPKLIDGQTQHDFWWRIALPDQEQQLLNNTYHLRQIMRLIKKLRDSQGMHGIANYYIKTLFLWEVDEKKNTDPTFWQRNDVATLFKHMLKKFCEALTKRSIPYFWNKSDNMIAKLDPKTSNEYKGKVDGLLSVLEDPSDYRSVAEYMLTSEEYQEYQQFL